MSQPNHHPPIFVVSPWRRCGTTLVQRALNSTGQAIIYGENFNFLENFPRMVAGVSHNAPQKEKICAAVRAQVLSGDHDIDASALFPTYREYADLVRSQFYAIARYYERSSWDYGRPVWGIKHQIRQIGAFSSFLQLLPKARYVFIERGIMGIARSDKARFPKDYPKPTSFAQLGRLWVQNTHFMRNVRGPDVLRLTYETLSADVPSLVRDLETHCGVAGIRPDVFSRKINVSAAIDRLSPTEAETHYRRPADLTAEETAALRSGVERRCAELGCELSVGL